MRSQMHQVCERNVFALIFQDSSCYIGSTRSVRSRTNNLRASWPFDLDPCLIVLNTMFDDGWQTQGETFAWMWLAHANGLKLRRANAPGKLDVTIMDDLPNIIRPWPRQRAAMLKWPGGEMIAAAPRILLHARTKLKFGSHVGVSSQDNCACAGSLSLHEKVPICPAMEAAGMLLPLTVSEVRSDAGLDPDKCGGGGAHDECVLPDNYSCDRTGKANDVLPNRLLVPQKKQDGDVEDFDLDDESKVLLEAPDTVRLPPAVDQVACDFGESFDKAWGAAYRAALDPSGTLELVRQTPMRLVAVSGVPEEFWRMLGTTLYKENERPANGPAPVCETVVMHEAVLIRRKLIGDNVIAQSIREMLANGCSVIYVGRVGTHRPGFVRANATDVTTTYNAFAVACQALLAMQDGDIYPIVKAEQPDGSLVSINDLVAPEGRVRGSVEDEWIDIDLPSEMALAVHVFIRRAIRTGVVIPSDLLLPMKDWVNPYRLAYMPEDDGPMSIDDTPGIGRIRPRLRRLLARMQQHGTGHMGAVLHGRPGTGKTMIVRALARESGRHFVFGSVGEWQACGHLGDMLTAMRATFDEARACQPAILFVDELDSFGTRGEGGHNKGYQRQVINAFLELVQGSRDRGDVVIIAATNDLNAIDPAILRAGRLGEHIRVPNPRREDTREILDWYLQPVKAKAPVEADVTAEALTLRCMGASPARIRALVKEASNLACEEQQPLSMAHFLMAMRVVANEGVDDADPTLNAALNLRSTAIHEAGHAFCIRILFGDDKHIELVTITPGLAGIGAVVSRTEDGAAIHDVGSLIRHGIISMAGQAALIVEGGHEAMSFGAGSDVETARRYAAHLVTYGLTPNCATTFLHKKKDAKAFSQAVNLWLAHFQERAVDILSPHLAELCFFVEQLLLSKDMEEEETMRYIGHLPRIDDLEMVFFSGSEHLAAPPSARLRFTVPVESSADPNPAPEWHSAVERTRHRPRCLSLLFVVVKGMIRRTWLDNGFRHTK